MRICLIGDSHLAALKQGWPAESHAPVEPVYFAGHGKTMRGLAVTGDALAASNPVLEMALTRTSGGLNKIDGHYDRYVVHGLELGLGLVLEAFVTNFSCHEHGNRMAWLAHPSFADILRAALRNSMSVHIMNLLRQISNAPIVFSPTAMSEKKYKQIRNRLSETGHAAVLLDIFSSAVQDLERDLNASFLPQPTDTLCDDRMATKEIYSVDPARFAVRGQPDDNAHMNAAYGAAVVRDLLRVLEQPAENQSAHTALPEDQA